MATAKNKSVKKKPASPKNAQRKSSGAAAKQSTGGSTVKRTAKSKVKSAVQSKAQRRVGSAGKEAAQAKKSAKKTMKNTAKKTASKTANTTANKTRPVTAKKTTSQRNPKQPAKTKVNAKARAQSGMKTTTKTTMKTTKAKAAAKKRPAKSPVKTPTKPMPARPRSTARKGSALSSGKPKRGKFSKAPRGKAEKNEEVLRKTQNALGQLPLRAVPWAEFLVPLGDRVLLVVDALAETTSGGIIIPGIAQDEPNRASVVAVGPGRVDKKGRRHPLDVQVGDRVLFQKYAGSKMNLQGESVLLVHESDIFAILEE